MEGIHIGKLRLGGFRLKSWAITAALAVMGLGNVVAGVMEWHDSNGMLIFNAICVVALVVAVMHKVLGMEPRKKWRILSFLVPGMGLVALFGARVLDSTNDYVSWVGPLIAAGVVLLVVGAVCIVRWRRASLAHKADLHNSRQQRKRR